MKKIKILLLVIGFFLILSIIFSIFIHIYLSLKNITPSDMKASMDILKKEEIQLKDTERNYQEWKNINTTYGDFINNRLYKFKNLALFDNELNVLVNKHSLTNFVAKNDWNMKGAEQEISWVRININVSGTYANIKAFIFDLERLEKMVVIKNLQLSRSSQLVQCLVSLEVIFVK